MGARVRGAGTPEVTIEGRPELDGADVTVIPDRIEAGTYMGAAAVTGGSILVAGGRAHPPHAVPAQARAGGGGGGGGGGRGPGGAGAARPAGRPGGARRPPL